jgi:hypothetical protein
MDGLHAAGDVAWALVIPALILFFVTVVLFGGAIGWASVVLLGLAAGDAGARGHGPEVWRLHGPPHR